MSWSRAFPEPLKLSDGKTVTTLNDAAGLILKLPKRHQEHVHWVNAAELLLKAAKSLMPSDLELANVQLRQALKAEGLVGRRKAGGPTAKAELASMQVRRRRNVRAYQRSDTADDRAGRLEAPGRDGRSHG